MGEDLSGIGAGQSGKSKTILCRRISIDSEAPFVGSDLALGSAMSSFSHCSAAVTVILGSIPSGCE